MEHATRRAAVPALVRALGLNKRYEQPAPFWRSKFVIEALHDVDLEIQPRGFTALVGESGSGKSTLASCLAMLEKPDRGEIWFEGSEVSGRSARELAWLRPKVQMVFQDSAGALNPRFSALEVIEEPLKIQGRASPHKLRQQACELMEEVGLPVGWANRSPLAFSGGERQRLAIARAIALQPTFLILDESLSGLDLVTQAQILNLLLDLGTTHALTYLFISHDLTLVGQVADWVVVMQNGRIVEQGSRQQVFSRPRHAHTRELIASAEAIQCAFRDDRPGMES